MRFCVPLPASAAEAAVIGGKARSMAGLAAAGLAVYALFGKGGFDWALFQASFARLDWVWIAVGAIFALVTYFGRALRWAYFLKHLRPKPDLWGLFKATAIGFTALVLVGRPGELVRPYLIAKSENLPLSTQLAAWALREPGAERGTRPATILPSLHAGNGRRHRRGGRGTWRFRRDAA